MVTDDSRSNQVVAEIKDVVAEIKDVVAEIKDVVAEIKDVVARDLFSFFIFYFILFN
jgi:hypothetical protein